MGSGDDAGGARESDKGLVSEDLREVKMCGEKGYGWPSQPHRHNTHIKHVIRTIILHPCLDELPTLQIDAFLDCLIRPIPGLARIDGDHAVHIDAHMVIVDVIELEVLDGVELDSEDVVRSVPDSARVEEPKEVLAMEGGVGVQGRGHYEGHAISAEALEERRDAEHKCGAKRRD